MTDIIPTSTSTVALPTDFLNPPGTPVLTTVSDKQLSIFETINESGQAAILQNPVSNIIGGLTTSITDIQSTITNSTCLSGGDKTTLGSSFTDVQTELSNLLTHTNTISGVIAATTGSASPGLDQILSVGQSLNVLSNTINGAAGCLAILNGMTGLFSGDLLNGYAGEIAGFLADINNCIADVAAIAARLLEIKNVIAGIISADQNFFADALAKLRQAALAGLLESVYNDPCGKFLLENAIGRTTLLNKLA